MSARDRKFLDDWISGHMPLATEYRLGLRNRALSYEVKLCAPSRAISSWACIWVMPVSFLHEMLLNTVREVTGKEGAFIQWNGTGPSKGPTAG
jgi:hypothetical protein